MLRSALQSSATALSIAACGLAMAVPAHASTFTVLHTFTGGADGANPLAGLSIDRAGVLYGTAEYGGAGYGTAFRLKPSASGWAFQVLYTFASASDGAAPAARLMPGPH